MALRLDDQAIEFIFKTCAKAASSYLIRNPIDVWDKIVGLQGGPSEDTEKIRVRMIRYWDKHSKEYPFDGPTFQEYPCLLLTPTTEPDTPDTKDSEPGT